MKFLQWLLGRSSARSVGMAHYKRGLARAERQDAHGALREYTSAIELADTPDEVKAMALYNRALVLAANGETLKAVADLRAVLAMEAPPQNVKKEAKRRLERMQRQIDVNSASRPNRRGAN